jgi:hypothetical protein
MNTNLGGYRMISLTGIDLNETNITARADIINELEKIDKPIMLTGIRINSKAKAPIFITYNEGKAIIYDRDCTFTRDEQGLTKITTKEVGA